MSKKNQKLTLDVVEQASSKYDEVKTGYVNIEVDGENKTFEIDIKKNFSPIGITNLISEFIKNMDFAKNVNKEGFGGISEPYLMYLIIKHFTSLGDSMPNKLDKQLVSLQHMMNTGTFFQIVVQIDEKEIKKLKEKLDEMMKTFESRLDLVEELKDEFYGDKIKNVALME